MEIRIRATGELTNEAAFRGRHSNISFPANLSEKLLNEFGADIVFESPQPNVTHYEFVRRVGVEQMNGKWHKKYEAVEMDSEAKLAADQKQARIVREHRTRLLAESDWTQLADAPVDSAAWAAYRQALRDVPGQPGFPWTVDWPVKP